MTDAAIGQLEPAVAESPARRALRKLAHRKGAMVALVVLVIIALLAIFAPLVAPHDPIKQGWANVRKPPSATFWFGTDEVGRDLFSRIIYGARASLSAGVVSVTLALLLGVPLGLLAGYRGGWVDAVISRFTDAMLACPFLILAIAMAAFLGPSLTNAMIAIGVSATPIFVRLTRGQVLNVKVEDYVEAARAVGNPPWRIALAHVLPNVTAPLIVQATLAIAAAVMLSRRTRSARSLSVSGFKPSSRAIRRSLCGSGSSKLATDAKECQTSPLKARAVSTIAASPESAAPASSASLMAFRCFMKNRRGSEVV